LDDFAGSAGGPEQDRKVCNRIDLLSFGSRKAYARSDYAGASSDRYLKMADREGRVYRSMTSQSYSCSSLHNLSHFGERSLRRILLATIVRWAGRPNMFTSTCKTTFRGGGLARNWHHLRMGNGSKLLHRRACSFARKFPTAGAVLVAFVVREPVENASLT